MGEKMAAILGESPAVLLKAHGVVAVGDDILECFALAAYVEENAYRQYMAMQIGDPTCSATKSRRPAARNCAHQACSRRPGTTTAQRSTETAYAARSPASRACAASRIGALMAPKPL